LLASQRPNRAWDEHKPSYVVLATGTLERVFFVTGSHHGLVRRHLDQMHFGAARRTLPARGPFGFHSELPLYFRAKE
jgi:hypothetical protein